MSGGHIRRESDGGVGPLVVGYHAGYRPATAFGSLEVENGSTAEATTDSTPRKVAAFLVNGLSEHMINDHTSDDIECLVPGTYAILFTGSFSGSNSKTYHVEIYLDGASTGFQTDRTLGAGGETGACSANAVLKMAAGEKVSVYHWSSDGGTAFTMTESTLVAHRIGD